MHMDFQRIVEDEKIRMNVPIHYLNAEDAAGVKQEGGSVSQLITDVEVTCLPKDLPEFFEVDIENLGLNEMLYIARNRTSRSFRSSSSRKWSSKRKSKRSKANWSRAKRSRAKRVHQRKVPPQPKARAQAKKSPKNSHLRMDCETAAAYGGLFALGAIHFPAA
jgi:hypothetical protein